MTTPFPPTPPSCFPSSSPQSSSASPSSRAYGYGERPALQGYRRSFTAPNRRLSHHEQAGLSTADASSNILFLHPAAKIFHFTPTTLDGIATTKHKSVTQYETDYPIDTVETLPWKSAGETTLAIGPLRIEKVQGSTNFIKCGSVNQAILKNTQVWCVDGVSRFVLRVRKLYYYRIELPEGGKEDAEETKKVEELKAVLGKILKYEVTPCPFKRGFHVELPASAITPRRRGKWERKDGTFSTETTPESRLPKLRSTRQWSRRAVSDGKVGINGGSEGGKSPWAQTQSPLAMRFKDLGDGVNEIKTDQERSETPDRLDEDEPLSGSTEVGDDEYLEQQELETKHGKDVVDEDEIEELPTEETELHDENGGEAPNDIPPAGEEARSYSSSLHLDADDDQQIAARKEDPNGMEQAETNDLETTVPDEASSSQNDEPSLGSMHEADIMHDDQDEEEVSSEAARASHDHMVVSNEADDSLLDANQADLRLQTGADSAEQVFSTKEILIDGHNTEEDELLTADKFDHAGDSTLPDSALPDDMSIELLYSHGELSLHHLDEEESLIPQVHEQDEDDTLSKVSSVDSFHTIPPYDDDEHESSPDPISSFLLARPSLHKREVSEITVTGPSPHCDIHPDPETPPEGLAALPESSSAAGGPSTSSIQLGLRNRLQARRSHSPPPPQSVLSSPQSQRGAPDPALTPLLLRATGRALSTPIEVVLFVVHVLARIAGGATINDLMSGELFRRPEQQGRRRRRTSNLPEQLDRNTAVDTEEEDDEDDFGMPIRTRRRPEEAVDADGGSGVAKRRDGGGDGDVDSLFELD